MQIKSNFPSVSVIIPSYNRLYTISRALDSVFCQTMQIHEVIVVDNGSTDHSSKVIKKKYPRIIILNENKRGVSFARNTGIRAASGDWVAFLDSDDEWLPKKLERQILVQSKNPRIRLVHTDEIWYRNGIRVNQKKKHEKFGGNIFAKCLPLCCISPSSVLVKKCVFDEIGYFDENLPACEDYDLWLRFTARVPVLYLEEKLTVKHNGNDDQLSKKYWGLDRFRILALEKILEGKTLTKFQEAAAQKVLIRKLKILLNGAEKRKNLRVISLYMPKLMKWEFNHKNQILYRKGP